MHKKHSLQFKCLSCHSPVSFSIFNLKEESALDCPGCAKKYSFEDPDLLRQLKKFEALCSQIHDSQEILGNASVGIDVGEHHVKVPYKLLLTRLNSSLELNMGNSTISIAFRMEPTKEQPNLNF